jgi:hypothetical protein
MDADIIKIRRSEVTQEISILKDRIAILSSELSDLDIAEKVFSRLSGASRNSLSTSNEPDAAKASQAKPDGLPTVREMIKSALLAARDSGHPGLTPKQIKSYIQDVYHFDAGPQVNTTASRMFNTLKEINKDETTGLYSLPSKEKSSSIETVGSLDEDYEQYLGAKGREAGPGGAM